MIKQLEYNLWHDSRYGDVHRIKQRSFDEYPAWLGLESMIQGSACYEIVEQWQGGLLRRVRASSVERIALENIMLQAHKAGIVKGRTQLGQLEKEAIAWDRYFFTYKNDKCYTSSHSKVVNWRKFHQMYAPFVKQCNSFVPNNSDNYKFVAYRMGLGVEGAKATLNEASAVLDLRDELGLPYEPIYSIDIDEEYKNYFHVAHYRIG